MLTKESRCEIETLLANLGINRVPNASEKEFLYFESKVKLVADLLFVAFNKGYIKGDENAKSR
jgi:hypothetical protein